jgi:hypothetical protein
MGASPTISGPDTEHGAWRPAVLAGASGAADQSRGDAAMITNSVTGDLILWALFWIIMVGALLGFLFEIRSWRRQDTNARDGMSTFPAESLGEPGPPKPSSGGSPRDAPKA